jgi:hypothetical protein
MGREEDWKRGAGGRQLRLESIRRKLRTRTDGQGGRLEEGSRRAAAEAGEH